MSNDHVLVSDEAGIRTIRMNRPEKKNALTLAMYHAMTAALNDANGNDAVRVVMFAGAPGAFSAGNDLQDFLGIALSPDSTDRPSHDFLPALATCLKPMVAAVSGIAVGIGTTMLFHCDHVVASSDATFSTPFAHLGLLPEAASSLLAPRVMGYARAFELLVMGRPYSAVQAKDSGFVNTIVPSDEVDIVAMKAAREIAALPPGAVAIARKFLRGEPDEVVKRINEETAMFGQRLKSPEARQALESFFSRKK